MSDEDRNEGEGSRTAAKNYNDRTKRFIETEDVAARAEEAAAALDGSEGEELRRAEEKGRAHADGKDPARKG